MTPEGRAGEMNINQFFEHWSIAENPFRGEEARHDEVLARLNGLGGEPREVGPAHAGSMHSDFEKILGEMTRPSTSVVFGEKGSGKTAIRCRSGARRGVQREEPGREDLRQLRRPEPARRGARRAVRASKKELAPFKAFRLVDHMDAVLAIATDRIVAALFNEGEDRPAADLGAEPWKVARRWAVPLRHDLLLLQALYDPADTDGDRSARLRRILRLVAREARGALEGRGCRGLGPGGGDALQSGSSRATAAGSCSDAVG
jgi:hypothetical protein